MVGFDKNDYYLRLFSQLSLMPKKNQKRSQAEKVSFSISLSIVSAIVALICYIWITGDSSPPILSVTTAQIRQAEQQYYVPFTVSNFGGETANSVEITAQLFIDSETIETGRQQVDFLSRQEKRSGEFIFSQDPKLGKLTIRVAGYKQP